MGVASPGLAPSRGAVGGPGGRGHMTAARAQPEPTWRRRRALGPPRSALPACSGRRPGPAAPSARPAPPEPRRVRHEGEGPQEEGQDLGRGRPHGARGGPRGGSSSGRSLRGRRGRLGPRGDGTCAGPAWALFGPDLRLLGASRQELPREAAWGRERRLGLRWGARVEGTGAGGVRYWRCFRAAELVQVRAAELPQLRESCTSSKVNF